MFKTKFKYATSTAIPDDQRLFGIRRDFSGGSNTRYHASKIGEQQCESITNWDIGVPAETRKVPGLTLLEDLGDNTGTGALGFEPRGGTNEILVTEGTSIWGWPSSGSFTEHDSGFTADLDTTIIKATCSGNNGDIVIISNGTDNVHQMLQDYTVSDLGDGNTQCPLTKALCFYRNRLWALKAILLYWSAALPATYDGQFDRTSNNYNITVGAERAVLGVRDLGLLCFGQDAVYGINPSTTPAGTDKPEKILDIGCAEGKTVVQVGDDVPFLSSDGVRGVFRTQQDKLQLGNSLPLTYPLKTEFETINWNQISKACAVYFDNKYFLALPVNASSYNNQVWVYYPATQAWMVIDGWNIGAWAKIKIGGEERLYAIDSTDSSVYRAWNGTTNNGVAITATFVGREEDFDQPLVNKIGGEIEIEAEVAGSGNTLAVSVALDGQDFQALGTLDLASGTAPTLPISLPFTLADTYKVRSKFHLDGLGPFRTIQIKVVNDDANTDPIIFYSYSIVTFPQEYYNE